MRTPEQIVSQWRNRLGFVIDGTVRKSLEALCREIQNEAHNQGMTDAAVISASHLFGAEPPLSVPIIIKNAILAARDAKP